MKITMPGRPGLALLAALMMMGAQGPALAKGQAKPPESASKIKKVLLYNKAGGWYPDSGIAEVKKVFSGLAAAKGFELVQLSEDVGITLDYLKQFQAIVWNNNTDGRGSVPTAAARQAVLDYVDQGGGWMLICFAADHVNTWPGLTERLGTTFSTHAQTDTAEVVMDEAADSHGELKWMAQGFPDAFKLKDLWFTFRNTVRPLPGVTVVATSRGPGLVVRPTGDGSGDNVYLWAREVGLGRLFYNAIGFGRFNIMEQQDSIVPRLYWENLRYVAGDYQNGCTTPASPGFNPAARLHVEAMCSTTGLAATPALPNPVASMAGRRMRLAHAPSQAFTVRARDIRGATVWERTLPGGTVEIALGDAIGPGVYHFEVESAGHTLRQRLPLP